MDRLYLRRLVTVGSLWRERRARDNRRVVKILTVERFRVQVQTVVDNRGEPTGSGRVTWIKREALLSRWNWEHWGSER